MTPPEGRGLLLKGERVREFAGFLEDFREDWPTSPAFKRGDLPIAWAHRLIAQAQEYPPVFLDSPTRWRDVS